MLIFIIRIAWFNTTPCHPMPLLVLSDTLIGFVGTCAPAGMLVIYVVAILA